MILISLQNEQATYFSKHIFDDSSSVLSLNGYLPIYIYSILVVGRHPKGIVHVCEYVST